MNSLPIPALGVAHSGYIPAFLGRHPDAVDYVEVPFELLRHDPSVIEVAEKKPIILHCASLSIGGSVECSAQTRGEIEKWVALTQTPWIGEHLAFVTAERAEAGPAAEAYAPGEPYNIGYTVSPPMNQITVERVARNFDHYSSKFGVPILLENSPLYFKVPTSTMSQVEFINKLCCLTSAGLILDLAHFYITASTFAFDALEEIEDLPLERVVEIHISGVDFQSGGMWDNHSKPAPRLIFELLKKVLMRANPRAITLEYNWSARFPEDILLDELSLTRTIVASRG
jgi:uncharacterized protein (UPF0276 family)